MPRCPEAEHDRDYAAGSFWDIVNRIMAYSRCVPHTDNRVEVETKAGKLMELVAA